MIESEERAVLPLPASISVDHDARTRLAEEWQAAAPQTEAEIARFYQESRALGADLDAWHSCPERQDWTRMLVHVAKEIGATTIVDIGAGRGHDLLALWKAFDNVDLYAVEPNQRLLDRHIDKLAAVLPTVDEAPIEAADLLICIDVLEHVPNPESFLGAIAQRAAIGCVLFETTATHDTATPLHLKANWGWHPGRVLERHGWECIDRSGRVRVWRRAAETGRDRASLLLCAYRTVNAETMTSIFALCASNTVGWRQRTKIGDALIARSRSIIVTRWWHETNDDVLLMVDDDIVFTPADADRVAELCRGGLDIVCGAYPVHDGGHMACRFFPGTGVVSFGPKQPVVEIEYAATGFVAVHRKVVDALVADLPLCHANQPWGFYPLFQASMVYNDAAGVHEWLSEDWGLCQRAREHGFRVWLDPQTVLTHLGPASVSVRNMAKMHDALASV